MSFKITVTENTNSFGTRYYGIQPETHWGTPITITVRNGEIEVNNSSGGTNSGYTAGQIARAMVMAWQKADSIIMQIEMEQRAAQA